MQQQHDAEEFRRAMAGDDPRRAFVLDVLSAALVTPPDKVGLRY